MAFLRPLRQSGQRDPLYHPSVFEENLDESHAVPDFNKAVFSWIAPEYLQHPKSLRWWGAAALILLAVIILEAFSGNWTMLVATVVFAAVYYFTHEYHPPRHTKVNLSELGVKIGHRQIPYADISCFWILYQPPTVRKLGLRLKEGLLPDLIIELENQNPQAVRAFLEQYLSEMTGVQEHWTEHLLRLFKL